MERKYIGFDINPKMIEYVNTKMSDNLIYQDYSINFCNSLDKKAVDVATESSLKKFKQKSVQFVLMHPPYMDIVKFTEDENDLSKIGNINEFVKKFKIVYENSLKYLDKNSEVIPLGFYCMDMIKRNFKVKLKGETLCVKRI